jgi:hypothetical protein
MRSTRNDRGAAADENGVTEFGQAQDGLRGLVDQGRRSRMQAEQFFHHVIDRGDAILRHELGQALGQVVLLQHLLDEVLVEHRPGAGFRWLPGSEEFGNLLGDRQASRARLARNGDHRAKAFRILHPGPPFGVPELAADEHPETIHRKLVDHGTPPT